MKQQVVMDIECYCDFFLVMFLNRSGDVAAFEHPLDTSNIQQILNSYEVVTFNGTSYDIPMLSAALQGLSTAQLKSMSDAIIQSDLKSWQFYKQYAVPELQLDHVDLIEVVPGMASLKIYGGRLHVEELEDLPIDPDSETTLEDREQLKRYCHKDLKNTMRLLDTLTPQIDLRRSMSAQYGQDLRSKSDAQIAEAVLVSEVSSRLGRKIKKPSRTLFSSFNYVAPEFVKFQTDQLKNALSIVTSRPFEVNNKGTTVMPKELEDLKIKLGGTVYQMGMGGLHSREKEVYYVADGTFSLRDWDVASYYPSIILNCGLYPQQMGEVFLDIYREIVNKRLDAKRSGNKVVADSLKICINGSFGKLGSCYSSLYSPDLMVQTTVTGQLSLLMLIEVLELMKIPVISGNTDGIVIKCPAAKESDMSKIIKWWENTTGFEMEESRYKAVYSRDVNNYIAIKEDGKVKTKGCFAYAGLQKNPSNEICTDALIAYLKDGVPYEETIRACKDIRKFVTVRTVKGGAVKCGKYLGKAIRWYYNGSDGEINYKTNGNKVPRSDGAQPLMDLPAEFPNDVDYGWYENEVKEMLMDVGVVERPKIEKKRRKKNEG